MLVRTAVGKLIESVHAADAQTAGELRDTLRFDYARPRDKPDGDWADRDTRMGLLGDVARDAQRALHAVQGNEALSDDEHVAQAARVLGEIIGQEYHVDEEDPRPRGGRRVRQIVSALDREMRHARQTPGRRFTGYKLHAAAAADAPVVTAISVAPANEHDGQHAGGLVDHQPQQRRPERVIGDTAYGNSKAREDLAQRSIRVLAPVHSSSPKHGAIPKDAFTIDLQADTVTCPQGHTTPIYKPRAKRATSERVARFARADCEPCPLRPRCAPAGQRDIRIRRREDLRQAALRELSDPGTREHLKRTRPRVERLLGLIVHRYHARKSRYLRARKATLQAAWTAVLVNLHPIAAALRAQTA